MKKKIVLAIALLLSVSSITYAQDNDTVVIRNKKGRAILPKAGDIALGFNALGLINLALDPFSGNKNSQVGVNTYTSNTANQITGKYYLTAKSAIRVTLGYNTLSGTIDNPVQSAVALYNAQLSGTPDAIEEANTVKVNDELTFAKSNIMVMAGYERRRGYGRLQGFYGASLGVGFVKDNSNITYGNALSNQYSSVYTNNWSTFTTATNNPLGVGTTTTRNLDTNYSGALTVGVRLFVGVEYFVFPKISVGAEFGWGYSVTYAQGYNTTVETYYNGQTGPQDVIQTINSGRAMTTHGFSVDNANGSGYAVNTALGSTALTGASGSITVLFHF